MDYLPIFIQLQDKPAVVVGGGRIATRKVDLLRKAGARIQVVAPQLSEELRNLANTGTIEHIDASFAPKQLDGAALVIAATQLKDVNSAVSRAARVRHVPVNVVDDPQLSTFIFPAIIDRSPVLVAVGSSGHSPVLARRVREQLEALLPARLGALARFVGDRRKEVQHALPPQQRRPFWERIIGGIVGSRVLAGQESGIDEAFRQELKGSAATGEVYLIGAGPGDPDLLTLRALQLLQQADVVLYDRLVSDAVLERARRDAERVYVGKEAGDHHLAQERIHELLLHYARQGLRVARLKGGDPFIFGRGGEEMEVLQKHGIPFVVVPGITAALGAAAAANIPLTHRHLAQSVTFTAGHALDDATVDWSSLTKPHHTVVFYMGVAQLPRIVERLLQSGASADLPVAIVERATLAEQRIVRGTVETIVGLASQAQLSPPALLIVGEVATMARTDLDAAVDTASAGELV
jgi:uroporphyrin-III C-methyltransferase / precorrin-2 dehydrogenase / sirohydrochlorin ferrochelatase